MAQIGEGVMMVGEKISETGENIVGAFSEGLKSANELKKAFNTLQTNVGLTKEEIEKMGPIIEKIYNNNFGESFNDVASAVALVNKHLWLTGDELQGATEKAFLMRDVFGYDINESVRSVDALMKNFGISSDEAFNLLTQGAQQGLDFSDELLDTVNEYSVQFKKAGLTAEDMFNILYDGTQTGAWNLDKIGDAVKEFNIRLTDGSKGTSEALEKLGMDSEKVALTMSEGGEEAKKTYSEIIDKIASMSNKQEQNLVGVALFGTMWEDLGPEVVGILGDIGDNFNSTIESADEMNNIKYDDLESTLEGLKRNFETGIIIPIGQAILPLIEQMIPKIQEVVNSIKSWIAENPKLATALFILMGVVGGILAILGPLIVFIGMLVISFGAMALFTGTILPIIGVIGAVIGVVVVLAMSIKSNWEEIKSATNSLIETVKPYFEDFKASFKGLWDTCKSIYDTIIKPLFKLIGEIIAECVRMATPILSALLQVFTMVFNTISSVWNGIGKPVFTFFMSIVRQVWSVVQPIFRNISNLFTTIVNSIRSIYNGVLKPVFDSFMNIVRAVANAVTPAFNTIKNAITTAMNIVLSPIRAVINTLNSLFGVIGKVASGIGGLLSKLNPFRSIDVQVDGNLPGSLRIDSLQSEVDSIPVDAQLFTANTPKSRNIQEIYNLKNSAKKLEGNIGKFDNSILKDLKDTISKLGDGISIIVQVGDKELKEEQYKYTIKRLNKEMRRG